MQSIYVLLPTPKTVQTFVSALLKREGDFELVSEGYILDARSLMGILNLDLTAPIELRVYNATPETLAALQPFTVEMPPSCEQENTAGRTFDEH